MLYKKMSGRLGNQLFQYAAVRAYQLKYRPTEKIVLDFSAVYKQGPKEKGFDNSLKDFLLPQDTVMEGTVSMTVPQKLAYYYYKGRCFIKKKTSSAKDYERKRTLFEEKLSKYLQSQGLFCYSDGFHPLKDVKAKNVLFYGFYESPKYFNEYKEILQKEFTPREKELKENKELYNIIDHTESVCVTVRAGDFLSEEFRERHYVCNATYFEEAIAYMKKKIKNPQFIVFSDDVEWVKENLKFPENTLYERGNDPVWEKLRLMYRCKHFILSNSTFSWWAEYLCRNEEKIVVAPSRWNNYQDNPDIYEEDWHLIEPKKEE